MKRLLTLAMSLLSLSVAAQTVASMNELNAVQKAAATNVKLTGKLSTGGNSDFRQLRDLCYQLRSIDLGSADCEAIPNNAFHSRHVLEQVVLPEMCALSVRRLSLLVLHSTASNCPKR